MISGIGWPCLGFLNHLLLKIDGNQMDAFGFYMSFGGGIPYFYRGSIEEN